MCVCVLCLDPLLFGFSPFAETGWSPTKLHRATRWIVSWPERSNPWCLVAFLLFFLHLFLGEAWCWGIDHIHAYPCHLHLLLFVGSWSSRSCLADSIAFRTSSILLVDMCHCQKPVRARNSPSVLLVLAQTLSKPSLSIAFLLFCFSLFHSLYPLPCLCNMPISP